MSLFLYLPDDSVFLAMRWLEANASAESVYLLHEATAVARAEELRARYPCVRDVVALDDKPETTKRLGTLLPEEGPRQITVPIALDTIPLRYLFPVQMPDVAPHHRLFRRLWGLGFREVELFNLSGTRRLRIPHMPDEFHGRHQGQRCFVVGNGPSLNQIDVGRLENEITLGANRCYLGYEKWGFPFTYWGIFDVLQIEAYGHEYETKIPPETVKFFPLEYLPLLQVEHGCPLHVDWPREASRQFSNTPGKVFTGYSVTYMLLQAAAIMGCDPIILIGVDHRYHLKNRFRLRRMIRLGGRWVARHYDDQAFYKAVRAGYRELFKARHQSKAPRPTRIWKADDAKGATHFDARYTTEKRQFLMPRPHDAEKDFECAARWARDTGVNILNATPDSALNAFPKVSYDSLF